MRAVGVAVACVSIVGVLAGCSRTSETQAAAGGAPKSGPVSVGYAGSHLSDPFQDELVKELKQQASGQGMSISGEANANDDPAKQVGDISTLLAQSPSALIVNPVDAQAIVPGIQRANGQNVPVVAIDQAPAGGKVAMVVRADNVAMGATACQEMGKLLNGSGTVLELQGALSSTNGLQRTQGFNDCVKQNFPNLKVVSQPTDWQMAKATTNAQTVMSTQQIDGVYWASDFFAPGIQKVLSGLDKWKKVGEPGHVPIVGIDATSQALDFIRQGYQDATVSQPLNLYAQYAVSYAKAAAAGTTFAEGPTDHDSTIKVTNGVPADLLKAPLVTKDNVDDASLWANAKS
jgi:ABC-type sugar transport system substrate-binding protein